MVPKQKITPHLWFDKEAKEAAGFYTSVFPDSRIKSETTLHDTPSGSVDTLAIEVMGQEFSLISAGPYFQFNPSISFLIACTSGPEVDALWDKLAPGGQPLIELDAYPFSERYGWLQDKYGVSWQVMAYGDRPIAARITPVLMFTGKTAGKAEEAIRHYTSVFRNAKVETIHRYGQGEEPDQAGTVKYAQFMLEGQTFAALDSARAHDFAFNEAISLMVHCDTQQEIDEYWGKLSADPAAEQCGWLKDKYGLSWQIVPTAMDAMMADKDPQRLARVTQAFLQMKKFNIQILEKAYAGSKV